LILELEADSDAWKAVQQLLNQRNVVIKGYFPLLDGRILLDCQLKEPDRLYRLALLIMLVPGVISLERLVSKGVMIKSEG